VRRWKTPILLGPLGRANNSYWTSNTIVTTLQKIHVKLLRVRTQSPLFLWTFAFVDRFHNNIPVSHKRNDDWGLSSRTTNKKFWEELKAYFPLIQQRPYRKRRIQNFCFVSCIRCHGNMFTETLPRNERRHTLYRNFV
jgi:hypothetical protein